MMRWRRRRYLPPDGDVPAPTMQSLADLIRNWRPDPIPQMFLPGQDRPNLAAPSMPGPPPEPLPALTGLDRYRLMLRFGLTATQVERLPRDIALTLLRVL